MKLMQLLQQHLAEECEEIHATRLQAVMDVASSLHKSKDLSLTGMARHLPGNMAKKHKVKKVDRLEGNSHLHDELESLYSGLSSYVLKYISVESGTPIIIDLCFLKDNIDIQMLSAEIALKGRSLPLYREVFKAGGLKGRAPSFLNSLSMLLPADAKVVIVMDAGFGEDWFKEIENHNWYWLTRVRQGKKVKLTEDSEWVSIKEISSNIGTRAKSYNSALFMVNHERHCRIITKKNSYKNTRSKYKKQPRNHNAGNRAYKLKGGEPWMLATNLPLEYSTTKIVRLYAKRMQIEESFRDIKSHRMGLSGRYGRSESAQRWAVKMLLAAIVQVVAWVVGVIGHSQGFQKHFQANTVRDKKVFSYFYLGQLILEFDKLKSLNIDYKNLDKVIEEELARDW